jgi:poly(A) polymerase
MILPPVPWRGRAPLIHLVDALGAREGLTRFVGGAVRDTLLHLPVADLDLATALEPDEVMRRLQAQKIKAIPTGLAHGTITAVLPNGPVEVTTLRRDVSTDGRHAVVAFTADWRADAARRDFTMNALTADPISGEIFDYFDGLADLEAGHVRFIGAPLERIAEDHLRILRFFRFHARFGRGGPDAAGLEACTVRANDLMALSRERIAQELLKLLAVADPVPTLAVMIDRAILKPVLPEIEDDGVARLARLVAREIPTGMGSPLRRLAALLPADPALAKAIVAREAQSAACARPRRAPHAMGQDRFRCASGRSRRPSPSSVPRRSGR